MRATIKDIAAETGFSVTTISLVLNGKGYKISDETKNQILAKARELNYRPNQLAVSLVKRQSKTIGFIVPDISNVYFANMARAIDEACRENGWSVILCNTNDNYDRDREYIDLLADKGADGIVFIMAKDNTREMAAEEIDYLESIHIPYVVVDRIPELRNCPAVGTDHEIGGYLAACAALAQPAARRPDFQLLFYPVVSMEEEFAHRPSMLRMFGRELHGLEAKRRSPLYRIDRAAPPAFLAAAADDGAVTPLGACRYAECLLAAGAGAALHLYPSGGHGFGLRREFAWREALVGELRMWLDATIGTV